MRQPCPPRARFEQLLADQLDAAQEAALSRHVEQCPACQQLLEQLTAEDAPFSFPPHPASDSAPPDDGLPELAEELVRRLKEQGRQRIDR